MVKTPKSQNITPHEAIESNSLAKTNAYLSSVDNMWSGIITLGLHASWMCNYTLNSVTSSIKKLAIQRRRYGHCTVLILITLINAAALMHTYGIVSANDISIWYDTVQCIYTWYAISMMGYDDRTVYHHNKSILSGEDIPVSCDVYQYDMMRHDTTSVWCGITMLQWVIEHDIN